MNNRFRLFLSICLMMASWTVFAQPQTFNVKDYGASGEKEALCTQAIQQAIDACYEAGGGQVYLPPGAYTSGSLRLKSNVCLYIEAGATLYASHDPADYPKELNDCYKNPVLLYADSAHHISIRGKGKIDGEALREYRDLEKVDRYIPEITENAREAGVEMKMYYKVPPVTSLLYFFQCTDLSFEDVTFWESTFWTIHLDECQRVNMRGMYVYSSLESGVNADGIDLTSCRDVTISDCVVVTGDDAICLKSRRRVPCEFITVSNCVVSSSSTGLKIGTGSHGDFRHVLFNNCVVKNSNRGLSIVVYDGCTVEDVIFSNITIDNHRRHFNWWGNGDAIWIVIGKRREKSRTGTIKNVVFENIIAHSRGTSRIETELGPQLENITLRNVQLFMHPEDYLDKRADHAFYAKNVQGLQVDGLRVHWATDSTEEAWGNALRLESCQEVRIRNFEGRQGLSEGAHAVMHFEEVADVFIDQALPSEGSHHFLQVEGAGSRNILLQDIDPFGHATDLYQLGEGVEKEAVRLLKP